VSQRQREISSKLIKINYLMTSSRKNKIEEFLSRRYTFLSNLLSPFLIQEELNLKD
jgi:hypothetical protein